MAANPSPLRRRPAAVSLLLVTLVAVAGCSSSPSAPAKTSAAAATGSASHGAASASETATSAASSTHSTTASVAGHLAGGGNFCQQAVLAQAAQTKNASTLATGSPAALQKFEQQSLSELNGFVALAPAAIQGDVKVVVAVDQRLYSDLSAVHFDVRKLNASSFSDLNTSAFKKATQTITDYLSKSCGLSATPTP